MNDRHELYELFEEALRIWHADTYLVRRRPGPAEGVYRWNVVDCETGQVCRIFYDSHLQAFDCGICRRPDVVDGHCRHSLLVRIDTYVTAYRNDRPDENRRAVIAAAIEAVREKVGIASAEPEGAGEEEAGQCDEEHSLLHDEDLYIEADEIIIPWDGAFYGKSLLELTETAEGRTFLQDLTSRKSDAPGTRADDLRRHVDGLICDTAQRVHAAICATYADDDTQATAA